MSGPWIGMFCNGKMCTCYNECLVVLICSKYLGGLGTLCEVRAL